MISKHMCLLAQKHLYKDLFVICFKVFISTWTQVKPTYPVLWEHYAHSLVVSQITGAPT